MPYNDGSKARLFDAVSKLSPAFALAVPSAEALAIQDDVAFFQAVRARLAKISGEGEKAEWELDHAIRQIVSRAVAPEGVIDIFSAAGLKKPDIWILSDEFLAEVRGMPQRNLAVELLNRLLNDETMTRMKKNLVQAQAPIRTPNGHRLGSRQRESSINQLLPTETEILRYPQVEQSSRTCAVFSIFLRGRAYRQLFQMGEAT